MKRSEKDKLEEAIKAGDNQQVLSLLAFTPKLIDESYDYNQGTVLHLATRYGHEQIIQLLIKLKPELSDIVDKEGNTFLHHAILHEHEGIISSMLGDYLKLIDVINYSGNTMIHYAASCGYESIVRLLLEKASQEIIDAVDEFGHTALYDAINSDQEKITELLISRTSHKAINAIATRKPYTVLYCAVDKPNENIVKMLLAVMTQETIEWFNDEGSNVLHDAVIGNSESIVRLLLPKMSQEAIDLADYGGRGTDILGYAAEFSNEQMINLLQRNVSLEMSLGWLESRNDTKQAIDSALEFCKPLLSNLFIDMVRIIYEYIVNSNFVKFELLLQQGNAITNNINNVPLRSVEIEGVTHEYIDCDFVTFELLLQQGNAITSNINNVPLRSSIDMEEEDVTNDNHAKRQKIDLSVEDNLVRQAECLGDTI